MLIGLMISQVPPAEDWQMRYKIDRFCGMNDKRLGRVLKKIVGRVVRHMGRFRLFYNGSRVLSFACCLPAIIQ